MLDNETEFFVPMKGTMPEREETDAERIQRFKREDLFRDIFRFLIMLPMVVVLPLAAYAMLRYVFPYMLVPFLLIACVSMIACGVIKMIAWIIAVVARLVTWLRSSS